MEFLQHCQKNCPYKVRITDLLPGIADKCVIGAWDDLQSAIKCNSFNCVSTKYVNTQLFPCDLYTLTVLKVIKVIHYIRQSYSTIVILIKNQSLWASGTTSWVTESYFMNFL